jgi:hypothetical protein
MFCFQLEQVVVFIPSTVSPVRVSLAGSGCVKAVRFADGGVFSLRRFQLTGKRKIFPDVSKVSIGNKGGLAQPAFPLAVLALQQVACALFTT